MALGLASGAGAGLLGMGDLDESFALAPGALGVEPVALEGDWPHQLTIHAIPAPAPIDWESPRGLLTSTVGNSLSLTKSGPKRAIGHMFVHLRTPALREELSSAALREALGGEAEGDEVWVGMTTAKASEADELVQFHGYGLGVLAADLEGRFENARELAPEVAAKARQGRLASIRYLLAPEAGVRLARYLREYAEIGAHRHYGGANRPLHGEGGGCAQFAVSFLELAGLEPESLAGAWRVDRWIPSRFFGGPRSRRRVSMETVLAFGGSWAPAPLAGTGGSGADGPIPFSIWEPTRVHGWITKAAGRAGGGGAGGYERDPRTRHPGLVCDVRSLPVPEGGIWKQSPENPYGRQPGLGATPP